MSHVPIPRRRGFTLMEILIAMTILMIGLLPMLAVFKTALNNLNRAIEDTYASSISQSVMDAIRMGMKDMLIVQNGGLPTEQRYFIFDHDAVANDKPPIGLKSDLDTDLKAGGMLRDMDIFAPQNAERILGRDYAILLPNATETETSPRGGTPIGRGYLYPRKQHGDSSRTGAYVKYIEQNVAGIRGRKMQVDRVFWLGQSLTTSMLANEKTDMYAQYSFAFSIRAAKGALMVDSATGLAKVPVTIDPNPKNQTVHKGLYELVVMVFRNFRQYNPSNPTDKRNDTVGGPGREFITYVSE